MKLLIVESPTKAKHIQEFPGSGWQVKASLGHIRDLARTGEASAITRLADDHVETDETEDLLVALRRAHVIDGPTMVDLLGRHLDECRHMV